MAHAYFQAVHGHAQLQSIITLLNYHDLSSPSDHVALFYYIHWLCNGLTEQIVSIDSDFLHTMCNEKPLKNLNTSIKGLLLRKVFSKT